MAKDGPSSTQSLVLKIQKIHPTITDSLDINTPFYTFMKSYTNEKEIQLFSASLTRALLKADKKYHFSDENHEFNLAIATLSSDIHLLEALFEQEKYKDVKDCFYSKIDSLINLDLSYRNYLEKNSPEPILPIYSQQRSPKKITDFIVDDEYLCSLFCTQNSFGKLDEKARGHFIDALLHLREQTSPYLVTLLGTQNNEDLFFFIEYMNSKPQIPFYMELIEIAKMTLSLRNSQDFESIENECKIYRTAGLEHFEKKKQHGRPTI